MKGKMDITYFKNKLEKDKSKLENEIKYYTSEDPYSDKSRSRGILEDDITEIEEHDRIAATKNKLEEDLNEAKEALKRIEKGNYGKCLSCGQLISVERLEAVPTAKLCLACQQAKK